MPDPTPSGNPPTTNPTDNNPTPPAPPNAGNKGGGDNQPAPPPQPPPVDINAITASARADMLKSLGYNSVAELQEALKAKSTKKSGGGDDTDFQKKIEFLTSQSQKQSDTIRNMRVGEALMTAISGLDVQLTNVADFKEVAKHNITTDSDGKVIIVDSAGNPRYNTKGDKLGVAEYLKQLLEEKAYFVKNTIAGGPGVNPNSNETPVISKTAKEVLSTGSFSIQDLDKILGKDKKQTS